MRLTQLWNTGPRDEDEGLSVPRGSQEQDEALRQRLLSGNASRGRGLFQLNVAKNKLNVDNTAILINILLLICL